jgi:hypothetical protein
MPGPGGTLIVELIGMGVSWGVRPTTEGVLVVFHAGELTAYHSMLMLVPAEQFAIILLTNAERGERLITDLFATDWVLRRFVGLTNLPAPPRSLSASELAQYEGDYVTEFITADNKIASSKMELTGRPDGTLKLRFPEDGSGVTDLTSGVVTFYAGDYVIDEIIGLRHNFLRDGSGAVVWFRFGGTLFRRQGD